MTTVINISEKFAECEDWTYRQSGERILFAFRIRLWKCVDSKNEMFGIQLLAS